MNNGNFSLSRLIGLTLDRLNNFYYDILHGFILFFFNRWYILMEHVFPLFMWPPNIQMNKEIYQLFEPFVFLAQNIR